VEGESLALALPDAAEAEHLGQARAAQLPEVLAARAAVVALDEAERAVVVRAERHEADVALLEEEVAGLDLRAVGLVVVERYAASQPGEGLAEVVGVREGAVPPVELLELGGDLVEEIVAGLAALPQGPADERGAPRGLGLPARRPAVGDPVDEV